MTQNFNLILAEGKPALLQKYEADIIELQNQLNAAITQRDVVELKALSTRVGSIQRKIDQDRLEVVRPINERLSEIKQLCDAAVKPLLDLRSTADRVTLEVMQAEREAKEAKIREERRKQRLLEDIDRFLVDTEKFIRHKVSLWTKADCMAKFDGLMRAKEAGPDVMVKYLGRDYEGVTVHKDIAAEKYTILMEAFLTGQAKVTMDALLSGFEAIPIEEPVVVVDTQLERSMSEVDEWLAEKAVETPVKVKYKADIPDYTKVDYNGVMEAYLQTCYANGMQPDLVLKMADVVASKGNVNEIRGIVWQEVLRRS